jgi:hypothetical protein
MKRSYLRNFVCTGLCLGVLLVISCQPQPKIFRESTMNSAYPISIVYFSEVPKSRMDYVPLIEAIAEDEPAAIILKFFFDEPGTGDANFIETLAAFDNILTQGSLLLEQIAPPDPGVLEWASITSDAPKPDELNIVLPYPEIAENIAAVGLVDFPVRGDELQGLYLAIESGGYLFPSLALATLSVLSGHEITYRGDTLYVGDLEFPDPENMVTLQVSRPGFYPSFDVDEVLDSSDETVLFENHVVLIYVDIPEVRRLRAGYDSAHNNAELVADSINTLLLGVDYPWQ